jgi:hypothetical protein
MVKVKYVGNMSKINIRVIDSLQRGWEKNEVRDLSEEQAKALSGNPKFEVVNVASVKKTVDSTPVIQKKEAVIEDSFDSDVDEENKKDNIVEE